MHLTSHPSRRTFLRGVGVSMALPWLETVSAVRADGKAEEPPVRFACLFSGNGYHSKEWWAKGSRQGHATRQGAGSALALPRETPVPERPVQRASAHRRHPQSCQTGNLLTGAHLAPAGEIRSGISFDQLVAEKIEGGRRRCRASYSVASRRSRRSTRTTRWCTVRTSRGVPRPRRRRSNSIPRSRSTGCSATASARPTRACSTPCVEDATRAYAARSVSPTSAGSTSTPSQRARGGTADRIRPARPGGLQGWRPTLAKPDMPRPADGIPQDIDQHMRSCATCSVLAFRTDTTRVCTLKLNNDHSSLRFPQPANRRSRSRPSIT